MPPCYLSATTATSISQDTEIKLETGATVQLQYKRSQEQFSILDPIKSHKKVMGCSLCSHSFIQQHSLNTYHVPTMYYVLCVQYPRH